MKKVWLVRLTAITILKSPPDSNTPLFFVIFLEDLVRTLAAYVPTKGRQSNRETNAVVWDKGVVKI